MLLGSIDDNEKKNCSALTLDFDNKEIVDETFIAKQAELRSMKQVIVTMMKLKN